MSEGVLGLRFAGLSGKKFRVLEAIDRFGVITTAQLERYLGDINASTIYRARKRGLSLGYVRERVYGMRKLVAITDSGAKFIGRNLKGVNLTNNDMYHQLIGNQVLLTFLDDYQDDNVGFQTERDIIKEEQISRSATELNKPNKIKNLWKEVPDIVITINGKVIAIEVEISRKTNKRIEQKLKKYKNQERYDSVFYICGNEDIRRAVENINDNLNAGIRLLMLHEVINPEEV